MKTCSVLLLSLVCIESIGCGQGKGQKLIRPAGISEEESQLLSQAEDETLSMSSRADAVASLGETKDKRLVEPLLQLLPGNGDLLTCQVIYALGQIGDPAALPKLKEMDRNGDLRLHGRINAELALAIELCGKKP